MYRAKEKLLELINFAFEETNAAVDVAALAVEYRQSGFDDIASALDGIRMMHITHAKEIHVNIDILKECLRREGIDPDSRPRVITSPTS